MSMPAEHLISSPTLADLLQGFAEAPAIPVAGIASDSRISAAWLPVPCRAGHQLSTAWTTCDQVRDAGACAIAWDASTGTAPTDVDLPMVAVTDLAAKLGEIAQPILWSAIRTARVVGITGTNGKTTVAWMVAQARRIAGRALRVSRYAGLRHRRYAGCRRHDDTGRRRVARPAGRICRAGRDASRD